jgi:Restriction endonuclease
MRFQPRHPTRILYHPRDVAREVARHHHHGFEEYVAERFDHLPGWSAQATPRSRDQGADVLITSPRGIRYLVQCKHVTSSLGSPDAQRTGGAAAFYGMSVDHAILLSALPNASRDTAFTAEARRYADNTGLKLWTLEELQLVADAEALGSDAPLAPLGLDTTLPAPPSAAPRTLVSSLAQNAFWAGVAVVVIWFGFQLVPGSARSTTTPPLTGTVSSDEPQAVLQAWMEQFRQVVYTNDDTLAAQFNADTELEEILRKNEDRRQESCRLEVSGPLPNVGTPEFVKMDAARFTVQEALTIKTVCASRPVAAARTTPRLVTYDLHRFPEGWRIVTSRGVRQ